MKSVKCPQYNLSVISQITRPCRWAGTPSPGPGATPAPPPPLHLRPARGQGLPHPALRPVLATGLRRPAVARHGGLHVLQQDGPAAGVPSSHGTIRCIYLCKASIPHHYTFYAR